MARRTAPLCVMIAAVLLTAAVGCGGGGGGGGGKDAAGGSAGPLPADFYGQAPKADPKVTLQPDVHMVAAGPSVIRGASGDGLTWTMDASDPDDAADRPIADRPVADRLGRCTRRRQPDRLGRSR